MGAITKYVWGYFEIFLLRYSLFIIVFGELIRFGPSIDIYIVYCLNVLVCGLATQPRREIIPPVWLPVTSLCQCLKGDLKLAFLINQH